MPTFAGELINAAVGVASLDDTGLRGGYRVVADLAARDAIVGTDFDKTGCLVHVQSNKVSYERTTTGWIIRSQPQQTLSSIYYATTGDDDSGDGTSGNPYATPQRCLDTLSDGSTGSFLIRAMDDGPFPAPQQTNISSGPGGDIKIVFVGNIEQTPTATVPRPVVVGPVAGKVSQHEVTTSGFVDPITTGSHWLVDGFSPTIEEDLLWGLVGVSLPSVSPIMKTVTLFGSVFALGGYDPPIYPISTVFETNGDATSMGTTNNTVDMSFLGLKFVDTTGTSIPVNRNCSFLACEHSGSTNGYLGVTDGNIFSAGGAPDVTSVYKYVSLGGVFTFSQPSGVNVSVQEATIQLSGIFSQHISFSSAPTQIGISNVDFENNATFCIRADVGDHSLYFSGNGATIDGAATVNTFLRALGPASVNIRRFGGTITGTLTGTAWDLRGRSYAEGLTALSATLTSVTEINLGTAGAVTYVSLPQNDFAAGTGVGTVVRS